MLLTKEEMLKAMKEGTKEAVFEFLVEGGELNLEGANGKANGDRPVVTRRKWTEEENEKLRAMWKPRKRRTEKFEAGLAETFDRTVRALRTQARRLKLPD